MIELDSPQYEIAFDQRRHPPVGVHREIVGLAVAAELHAGIDPLIGEVELAQAPQHFLHIDRIGPAPDRQSLALRHAPLPISSPFARFISEFFDPRTGLARGGATKKAPREAEPFVPCGIGRF